MDSPNRLVFPENFVWGSSTSAAQVETATDHSWRGLVAKDGHVFDWTTEHEKHRLEDAEWITRFGSIYLCSVDWSRLQKEPFGKFDRQVVKEHQTFFDYLQTKGTGLMLVLHHFVHPNWFEAKGGFTQEDNIPMFLDYTRQCIKHFGEYVLYWNTFNEPNIYALNAFLLGHFPPFKKGRYLTTNRVLDNMGKAHDIACTMIKEKSDAPIGISLNTAYLEGKGVLGHLLAAFVRRWFMGRAARPFEKCDFWGLSYYAYVLFDPLPMDAINRLAALEKRQIPHDKIWAYKPEGLDWVLRRFHKKYGKPLIITGNGICTDSSKQRIQALRDYLSVCHQAIQEGVDLRGYIHCSTWDNFEWHLGPTYRFGLVKVDFNTMERSMTEAGLFYEKIVRDNAV